jgi:hypothetical protein
MKTHKVDCISNVSQVKEVVARKAIQTIKQGAFESLSQYSNRFRETYQSYKNTANSGSPVDIAETEQAMDFFHVLDNGQYAVFKTNMLNGWAMGAFDPPYRVNQIYRIAATWVKPVPCGEGGTAVSYVTLEDYTKKVNSKQRNTIKRSKQRNKERQW